MCTATVPAVAVEVNAVEVNVSAVSEVNVMTRHSVSCARRHAAKHGCRMLKQLSGHYRLTRLIPIQESWQGTLYRVTTVAHHLSPDGVIALCEEWERAADAASWKGQSR